MLVILGGYIIVRQNAKISLFQLFRPKTIKKINIVVPIVEI